MANATKKTIVNFLKQKEGERFLDWKHRIYIAKVNQDIKENWAEIKELLKIETSIDSMRKHANGIHEYYTSNIGKMEKEASEYVESLIASRVGEIEEAEYKNEKKKWQFFDQRRERNHIMRWEERFDHFRDEIIKSIKFLAEESPIEWKNQNIPFNVVSSYREGALIISDWHRGLSTSNYWNTFNNEEFDKRVERLVEKTIQYSVENGVRVLNVFGIGDFVNGIIHVTTRISNTEDIITQTMKVCEILSLVMARFANIFDKVNYYHCRGNHDRVSADKREELARESFADFIPFYMKSRLSHVKNFEIKVNVIDDEIITTEICGKKIIATHGHRDRISNVVENLSLMTKIIPDFIFMGHYHHHEENEVQGIEVIINSSFSGVDDYAKEIRKTSKPAQKLIIFDDKEGRLCTYNIGLNI